MASQQLAALEQDVLAVAAAAAEALHTPRGSAKAAGTKAAAAARALRLATKWAAAAGAGAPAVDSLPSSSAGPAATQDQASMAAVVALLEQLESHSELPGSLADACKQHKAAQLMPAQPLRQAVWSVHDGQPPLEQPAAGRQQQRQQQQQPQQQQPDDDEESSCAGRQAAQQAGCLEEAGSTSMGVCSAAEVFSGGQASGPVSAAATSAGQGSQTLERPECCTSLTQQREKPDVPQHAATVATAAFGGGTGDSAAAASSLAESLHLAERTQAAAAAMLGKQERALARAAAAGTAVASFVCWLVHAFLHCDTQAVAVMFDSAELEASRLAAGGWHDAAAAAAASAAKWRRR